jgi:hypothetical protein
VKEGELKTDSAADAVRHVVMEYVVGLHSGDTDRLAAAFHPSAILVGWDEGELRRVPLEQWFAFIKTVPSPSSKGLPIMAEILTIDVFGTVAMAKLREVYREFSYIDFLSLVWIDARWQIVHKIYHQMS